MKIMIISDDHGHDVFDVAYKEAERKYSHIDAVIHAGDTQKNDLSEYKSICNCEVYGVRGNNDFNMLPWDITVELGGKTFFITHGHRYGVYMDYQRLFYAGAERGADIIVFGHTHQAFHQKCNGIDIINPGSLAGLRCCSKSYIVLELKDDKIKLDFNAVRSF